jgi:hypothetical protein
MRPGEPSPGVTGDHRHLFAIPTPATSDASQIGSSVLASSISDRREGEVLVVVTFDLGNEVLIVGEEDLVEAALLIAWHRAIRVDMTLLRYQAGASSTDPVGGLVTS